jgi:hypothetical protein
MACENENFRCSNIVSMRYFFCLFSQATDNVPFHETLCANIESPDVHVKFISEFGTF